jgi:hypothetical protein
MPTITLRVHPAATPDDNAPDAWGLTVDVEPGHDQLPANWTRPTPFEWGGLDEQNRPTLTLVSATWGVPDLMRYGTDRWMDLMASRRDRAHRGKQRLRAIAGHETKRDQSARADEALLARVAAVKRQHGAIGPTEIARKLLKAERDPKAIDRLRKRIGLAEKRLALRTSK